MKALYLLLHIFTVSFPLLRSFEPKIQYAKKWKALLPAIVITATCFIIWDVIFTEAEVWGFNERYYLGLHVFGLPLEEWLFFVTVPFASVFIYECIIYFFPNIQRSIYLRAFTFCLAGVLLVIGVLNQHKAYTFWNFILSGSFLVYTGVVNPRWLGKFWMAYVLHLMPFLLVNGILTGSIIEEEVVWYNNAENLSIRVWTIPIEDFVYAMLLLLMNISIYEYFKKRKQLKTSKFLTLLRAHVRPKS